MQTFKLVRDVDVSGISGTGTIAEGCVVSDGRVILAWLGRYPTMEELPDVAALEAIHGHGGRTHIVYDESIVAWVQNILRTLLNLRREPTRDDLERMLEIVERGMDT